ncbi:MAG: ABC transporter ATP-binding protein [Acutalibacteraceae bacterium]
MIFKTYGRFLKPYTSYCIIGPLAKLFEAILELYLPLLMAQVIDNGVLTRDVSYLLRMGGIMLGIVAVGLCSALVCQYVASRTSQGFGTELRRALFSHILSFSGTELDRFGTASLINRLTNDINQLQYAVAMLIRLVIRAPFLCIGGVIMAAMIDWQLALIILIAIPIFVCILWLVSRKAVPLHRTVQKRLDRLAAVLSENLSGVRVIRAFARRREEKQRFDAATKEHTDAAIRAARLSALLNPATTLIMNLAVVCILWFGNIRVETGHMTTGEIIAFINYVNQILVALTVVANLISTFSKAYASAGRVAEVLATRPAIANGSGISESADAPAVTFEKVCFSYNSGEEDLTDISFSVPHGATVGIIGGTGTGKSTLIRLMMRFYDVSSGRILIDGKDVRDYAVSELRARFALVSQKVELFSGTVADNIRLGAQDATDEDVISAAKDAQAYDFIMEKERGFDTPVERGGANLSGGQKQRIAIARALCRRAPILLLDDASSALDYATDAALRRAIAARCAAQGEPTTVFLISQRVSAIRHADMLLVMDDGRLAGIGSHEELMESCELYRKIVSSQERGEEVSA